MVAVVHSTMNRNDSANQWAFVLSHFPDVEGILREDESIAEVVEGRPAVLVQLKNGRFVQAATPLSEFNHPEECVYVFGRDEGNIVPEDLEGVELMDRVYIDHDGHEEMFSWVAAAIVLWDRRMKRG